MSSGTFRLSGLIAATHTPVDPHGRLNLVAVEQQAQHLVKNRVAGVFIAGTTGESHSFTVAERMALAERWIEVAKGSPLKVVVHVGSNCLADAQQLAAHAERHGAAAISALAPSYFRPPTPRHLAEFLAVIAASAAQTPFYFYDIPSWTGVTFPASQILTEVQPRIPNFAGVKFTNSDLAELQRTLAFGDGAYDILWGTDEALLAGWSLGCRGAVGSTYNFAAPIYHCVIEAFSRGDLIAANQAQRLSVLMVGAIAKYGFLPASKRVMAMLGVDCGSARLPLAALDEAQEQALRKELTALGFFEAVTTSLTFMAPSTKTPHASVEKNTTSVR